MKEYFKKTIIVFVLVALAVLAVIFYPKTNKEYSVNISDQEIMQLLKENPDCVEYMGKNPDFVLQDKSILTVKDIEEGLKGPNFIEVYYGLDQQESRYMKLDLVNTTEDNNLIVVIDLKNGKVDRAYGKILLKATVPNGQETSQTAN